MISKRPGSRPNTLQVTFAMPDSTWAESISLVGDFNDWDPEAHPLARSLAAGWHVTLELERGHSYEYRYLLDRSEWSNNCNADGYSPNPFGGLNSVVNT